MKQASKAESITNLDVHVLGLGQDAVFEILQHRMPAVSQILARRLRDSCSWEAKFLIYACLSRFWSAWTLWLILKVKVGSWFTHSQRHIVLAREQETLR